MNNSGLKKIMELEHKAYHNMAIVMEVIEDEKKERLAAWEKYKLDKPYISFDVFQRTHWCPNDYSQKLSIRRMAVDYTTEKGVYITPEEMEDYLDAIEEVDSFNISQSTAHKHLYKYGSSNCACGESPCMCSDPY